MATSNTGPVPRGATPSVEPRRARPSPWVVLPPPPLFVVAVLLGRWLDRAVAHVPLAPSSLQGVASGAGIALAALGLVVLAPAPLLFARRRTTIVPHRAAVSLVVDGPYRFTRNPMYVGLTVIAAGAALALNTAWPLLLLAFPLWILHTKTIPFEERTLERVFGDEYRAYCERVPRWIGRRPRRSA